MCIHVHKKKFIHTQTYVQRYIYTHKIHTHTNIHEKIHIHIHTNIYTWTHRDTLILDAPSVQKRPRNKRDLETDT